MEQIELILTDSGHENFQQLSSELEQELYARDGDLAAFNQALNKIGPLPWVILLYVNDEPVACGGLQLYSPDTGELKRVYVKPAQRRRGFASRLLLELEDLARSMHFRYCLLETGRNQPEAVALYHKHGYEAIENFGKYAGSLNSLCFRKRL